MSGLPRGRRILVTGGAGFVGSHLVALLAEHNDVVVLDDLSTGRRDNVTVPIIEGDVRDTATVAAAVAGRHLVFHLAVRSLRHGLGRPRDCADVNALGSLNVALACRDAAVERLVYVSSSEVYGNTRDGSCAPTTVYAASKLAGELHCQAVTRTWGLPVTVLRPFNAYGPRCHLGGPSAELIPRYALRLRAGRPLPVFGDGQQDRAFTWVGDTALGIALAGAADCEGPLDLSRAERFSVRQVGEQLGEILGIPATWQVLPPRPGDVGAQHPDPEPARRALGFEAATDLQTGLRRFVAWLAERAPDPERWLDADRNW